MFLLDESLANARALGRRPLLERVLLSRRDRLKASPALARGQQAVPPHRRRDTAQSLLFPCRDKSWQDRRCGEELQGLAALHPAKRRAAPRDFRWGWTGRAG